MLLLCALRLRASWERPSSLWDIPASEVGMFAIGYTADSTESALTDAGAQILIASMRELPARLALD